MLLCRRFETADRGIGLRPAQRADVREEVQQSLLGLQLADMILVEQGLTGLPLTSVAAGGSLSV